MMSVFNETIDEAIRKLLDQMAGFPVAVWSREFLDGYRAYVQKEPVDAYSLVLPKEAPQRRLGKIDDNTLRPQLNRIFAAMNKVVQAVRLGKKYPSIKLFLNYGVNFHGLQILRIRTILMRFIML